jgi:uncharacterized phage-like protein YoqJ
VILAGTGHRKIGGCYGDNSVVRAVVARMGAELDRLKPARVISGMALGVDQWLAWLAVKRGVPFTAAVPFKGQEARWPVEQRAKYEQLMRAAAEHVFVSDVGFAAWKLQKRNEWMVDHCDVLLAVWDGSSGGTANCVNYATRVGRVIVRIDPREIAA